MREEQQMTSPKDELSKEVVEEELRLLVQFIEQHLHWAKADEHKDHTRLNMVTAESLIEAANLVRALCQQLSSE